MKFSYSFVLQCQYFSQIRFYHPSTFEIHYSLFDILNNLKIILQHLSHPTNPVCVSAYGGNGKAGLLQVEADI